MTKAEPQESPEAEKTQPSPGGLSPLTLQFIVGLVAAVVVVAVAAGINHAWPIFGESGGGSKNVVNVALPTAQPTQQAPVVDMDVGDAPTKGPSDAKVQIVEFSDFQCPYCARFVQQTLPQILSNYGDKVLFAFRNFPLTSIHPYAQKAAEAGECAADQGKFWEYHDILFEKQSELTALVQADATNGVNQAIAKMKEYAGTVSGLDSAKFAQCLDSGADAEKVASDATAMETALQNAGVTRYGTPAFFINGKFISGAYPYDENSPNYQEGMFTFKAGIEEALAAAK